MKMTCPNCQRYSVASVMDSRSQDGAVVRYRRCGDCRKNYKTLEVTQDTMTDYAFSLLAKAMEKDVSKKKVEAAKWKATLRAAVLPVDPDEVRRAVSEVSGDRDYNESDDSMPEVQGNGGTR